MSKSVVCEQTNRITVYTESTALDGSNSKRRKRRRSTAVWWRKRKRKRSKAVLWKGKMAKQRKR